MVIAILAGCSKTETPSSSTPSSSTPSSSQGSSTPASSDTPEPSGDEMTPAEKAIAERKESGNYPKVIFSFFTWNGAPAGQERIAGLLSDYCKEKIGVEVGLYIADATTYRTQLPLMLGFYDSQEKIPEMCERLNSVGLTDYMEAKKAALTEWATAKGLADKL